MANIKERIVIEAVDNTTEESEGLVQQQATEAAAG